MDDFPIWVQCLPKVLFNVIVAREESDVISKEALRTFYEKFGGLTGSELERTAEQGFNTATDVIIATTQYTQSSMRVSLYNFRTEITNWTTLHTNSSSPTSF